MKRWMVGSVVALCVVLASGPAIAGKTAHFERSFPAAGIQEVKVEVSFHDVRVVATPGDTIEVTVDLETRSTGAKADKILARATPGFTVDGKVLEISAGQEHRHWWGSGSLNGTVTILLPPGRHLDVDTASGDCRIEGDLGTKGLEVDTASGDVDLDGTVEDAEIDTASGEVRLRLRRPAGTIELETASGDVVVTGEMTRLEAGTASGDLRVSGSVRRIELETSSGDVDLRWERVSPGSLADIETASGDVRLTVPAGTAVAGTVTTYSGEIASDLPGRKGARGKVLELTAADPKLRVEISTSSGDVSLKTAKD